MKIQYTVERGNVSRCVARLPCCQFQHRNDNVDVVAGLSNVSSFLFWLVAQRMLAFTDVSGQCMGPIFMEQSVIFLGTLTHDDGVDMVFRNVGNVALSNNSEDGRSHVQV